MSANDPAMLQFPGLLAAVVNDALKDGVPRAAVVAELEALKFRVLLHEFEVEYPGAGCKTRSFAEVKAARNVLHGGPR